MELFVFWVVFCVGFMIDEVILFIVILLFFISVSVISGIEIVSRLVMDWFDSVVFVSWFMFVIVLLVVLFRMFSRFVVLDFVVMKLMMV